MGSIKALALVLVCALAACGGGGSDQVLTRSCASTATDDGSPYCAVSFPRQLGEVVDVKITARLKVHNETGAAGAFDHGWHLSFDGDGYEYRSLGFVVGAEEKIELGVTLEGTFTVTTAGGDRPVIVGLASYDRAAVDVPAAMTDIVVTVTRH